jgi:hypothetical protein
VEPFVVGGHGLRLWSQGSGWSNGCSPPAREVRDGFNIANRGITLVCDLDIPLDAPIGDHQVNVTSLARPDEPRMLRLQLVSFDPGGFQIEITAPYSHAKDPWIDTTIQFQ